MPKPKKRILPSSLGTLSPGEAVFLRKWIAPTLSGAGAGVVNGLFGAGGGMVLVPLLERCGVGEDALFPTCVAVMAPVCLVSLGVYALESGLPWQAAWPYLIGSALGGLGSCLMGRRVPRGLLHKALGLMILWGGVRNLC